MNVFASPLDLVACPLPIPQPKSDVSDFGQLIKWPNSGLPEFGCKRRRECTEYAALNCFATGNFDEPLQVEWRKT
jgi:hypothetical protein